MRLPALLFLLFVSTVSAHARHGEPVAYRFFASGSYKAGLGDWAGALKDFERAYRANQTSSVILVNLAEAYYRLGRFPEAVKFAERALSENSASSDAHVVLSEVAIQQGNLAAAEVHLSQRLVYKPDDIESRLKLGLIRENQNDMEGVVRVFDGYPPRRPGAALAAFHKGIALIRLKRLEDARAAFREALRENPVYMEAAENIALLSEELDDDSAAISAWEKVIEIDPMDVDAKKKKITLLLANGRLVEAQKDLKNLLEIVEDRTGDLRRLLVQIAINNRDFSTAARALEKIARDVGSESGFFDVAIIAAQSGRDTDLVIRSLEQAYSVSKSERILMMVVRTHLLSGNQDSALRLSHEATQSDKVDTTLIWNLGLLHHSSGDERGAISLLLRLIERDPHHAPALNYVGYTWAEKGIELDRAEQLIRRALDREPGNGQYLDSLGWVHFKLGRLDLAKRELEEAILVVPGEPTILEHLGDVALALGSRAEALQYYRQSLATGKSENEAALRTKISTLE